MENNVIYDAIQSVAEQTEYNGGGIETLLNGRVVKSVQRGKTDSLSVEKNNPKMIPISAINVSKSVLVINHASSGVYIAGLGIELYQDYIYLTMNNSSNDAGVKLVFSWQVIEFY